MGVNPGALLTKVGHLQQVRIQSRFGKTFSEGRLMKPRRTRGHHDPVQALLLYIGFDLVLARLRTKVALMAGDDYIRKCLAIGSHCRAVHDPCDIRPTMADINPYSTFLFFLYYLHLNPLSFENKTVKSVIGYQ
jgi:hypothetical protein